jgi:hypothetical protein
MTTTTLTAIAVTLLGGGCVLLLCVIAFQYALSQQSTKIAPRCSARPASTISNPWAQQHAPNHVQHRCGGNWVKWVMSLSDETLLRGVPGTGTREGGLKGSLLHVTLDSIVLLRFHALGRKVATLATILCLGLLLPLYMTTPKQDLLPLSQYNNTALSSISLNCTKLKNGTQFCDSADSANTNTTSFLQHPQQNYYRRTTLGNVPNLYYLSQHPNSYLVPKDSIKFRLRAAVLVVWLVTIYTFYLLAEEWAEMVCLRRVWYLEQRRGHSLMQDDPSQLVLESEWHRGFSTSSSAAEGEAEADNEEEGWIMPHDEQHLHERDAWIPHPEQPDTVPNIEPYSMLIGPLPKPRPFLMDEDSFPGLIFPQQLLLKRIIQQLEEQLPKEPGYTSPICAITVVPTAKDIGPVWRQWYTTLMKLRRLLLIEQRLRLIGHVREEDDTIADTNTTQNSAIIIDSSSSPRASSKTTKASYVHQVFGGALLDEEWMVQAQTTMGPEQLGAFSRELAQGASNCCPYGCFEGQVRHANLATLQQLHQLQKERVKHAKEELQRVQKEFMFRPTLDCDDEEDELENEEEESALLAATSNGFSQIRNTDSWRAKNGFFTRKRSFASRCLSESKSNDSDVEEEDGVESSMVELVSPSSAPPSRTTSSGSWRQRRSERGRDRWVCNQVLARHYFHQLKFQVMELLSKYNHPSSWKALLAKCWKTWEHEDSYAVLTFTSRQAAAAARQSLSSSGIDLNDIPIPPLADAGAFRLFPFRFFCRPVTVTINAFQKAFRLYM